MKYSEKIKSPQWQKKRLEILERDGWKCKICGDDESTLHVHHRIYKTGKEPWDYPDDALITLCEKCHKEETNLSKEYSKIIDDLIYKLKIHFDCMDIAYMLKTILDYTEKSKYETFMIADAINYAMSDSVVGKFWERLKKKDQANEQTTKGNR